MIAITYGDNGKSNQQTINAFSFAGLMLDVIGTSIGLINGVLFQKRILQLMNLQIKMEEMPRVLQRIQALEEDFLRTPNSAVLTTITEELEKLWKAEQIRVSEFNNLTPLLRLAGSNADQNGIVDHLERLILEFSLRNLLSLVKQILMHIFLFANPVSNAASSATSAILAGVLCFICGICVLVINTEPFAVSFTTIFVLCFASLACCIPLILLPITDLVNRLLHKVFPKALIHLNNSNSLLIRLFGKFIHLFILYDVLNIQLSDAYGVVMPYNNRAVETELRWLTQQFEVTERL